MRRHLHPNIASLMLVLMLIVLSACQINQLLPQLLTASPMPRATPTASLDNITLSGADDRTLPVGTSDILRLSLQPYISAKEIRFEVAELPKSFTTEFLSIFDPWNRRLVVNVNDTSPGTYQFSVVVTVDGKPRIKKPVSISVVPCNGMKPGVFTQAVTENLVYLITAGKPAWNDGLLVPILICKPIQLKVTKLKAMSEAQTAMNLPQMVLYRSLVYPAPTMVDAHNAPNVASDFSPVYSESGTSLRADVSPGLYLLVFVRDGYPGIQDPKLRLAQVTYALEIQ